MIQYDFNADFREVVKRLSNSKALETLTETQQEDSAEPSELRRDTNEEDQPKC
jgi:hypothetical protein